MNFLADVYGFVATFRQMPSCQMIWFWGLHVRMVYRAQQIRCVALARGKKRIRRFLTRADAGDERRQCIENISPEAYESQMAKFR